MKAVGRSAGPWHVSYRNGLVSVRERDTVIFSAFIENASATVQAVRLVAESGPLALTALSAVGTAAPQPPSEKNQKLLVEADKLALTVREDAQLGDTTVRQDLTADPEIAELGP